MATLGRPTGMTIRAAAKQPKAAVIGRTGGENALDIGLGTQNADDYRKQVGYGRFKAPAEQGKFRWRHVVPGCGAIDGLESLEPCNEQGKPDDAHLQDAADSSTLHAAEECISDDKENQDYRGNHGIQPKKGRNDFNPRQAAGYGRKENANGRNNRRQFLRPFPVMEGQELGNGLQPGAPHAAGIKNAHDNKGNAASQRKPPGRQAEAVGQLGRAHSGTATDDGACHQRYAGAPAAYAVSRRRLYRPGMVNTDADDKGYGNQNNNGMGDC